MRNEVLHLLADRLKVARAQAGYSQEELAQNCNISQASISKLESGRAQGSVHIAKIAAVCGVSAGWLAYGKDAKRSDDKLRPPNTAERELTDLGQRLVRFGYALQEQSSTVAELASLASACGIRFQLRAVAESAAATIEARSQREDTSCA